MVKLATPISDLFNDDSSMKKLAASSSCLECREKTLKNKEAKQYLFHFDKDIIRPWSKGDKEFIQSAILLKKELKVVSFHMSVSCSRPVLKQNMYYKGGKDFSPENMMENVRNNISWLKSILINGNVEIAAENNNYYPTAAYKHVTEPEFISKVILENNMRFLFDIAHARITAYNKKSSYAKYIRGLPLKSMIQIHVSKFGVNAEGIAYDAHELPDEQTFQDVKLIARSFSPEYLTIEYYKDADKLLQTLEVYRNICG